MTDETILDPIETDREIRAIYAEAFDTSVANRKTLGCIPPEIHTAVIDLAKANKMLVGECVASMLKFRKDYESEYAEFLTEQRTAQAQRKGSLI